MGPRLMNKKECPVGTNIQRGILTTRDQVRFQRRVQVLSGQRYALLLQFLIAFQAISTAGDRDLLF